MPTKTRNTYPLLVPPHNHRDNTKYRGWINNRLHCSLPTVALDNTLETRYHVLVPVGPPQEGSRMMSLPLAGSRTNMLCYG